MKKKELKELLKAETSKFVPNHQYQIREKIKLVPIYTQREKSVLTVKKKMAPVLALGLLTIILTFVLPFLFKAPVIPISNTFVTIDINPSIEIEASPDGIISGLRGLNKDAVLLLRGEENNIVNKELVQGILEIIKLASENDYLNENDVLITTVNNNQDHELILTDKIVSEIKQYLIEKDFKGEITSVPVNKKLKQQAQELELSVGKLNKILTIIESNPNLSIDDLKDKSIKELNNIIKNYSQEIVSFQEKYDKLFSELSSKALVELDQTEEDFKIAKGKINRLNTVLKQLEKAKDKINDNKYQKFLAQAINIYSELVVLYPNELEPYREDMEVSEIVEALNTFKEQTNLKIENINQNKNQKVNEIKKNLKQKIKENIEKGAEDPFSIDLEDVINNLF